MQKSAFVCGTMLLVCLFVGSVAGDTHLKTACRRCTPGDFDSHFFDNSHGNTLSNNYKVDGTGCAQKSDNTNCACCPNTFCYVDKYIEEAHRVTSGTLKDTNFSDHVCVPGTECRLASDSTIGYQRASDANKDVHPNCTNDQFAYEVKPKTACNDGDFVHSEQHCKDVIKYLYKETVTTFHSLEDADYDSGTAAKQSPGCFALEKKSDGSYVYAYDDEATVSDNTAFSDNDITEGFDKATYNSVTRLCGCNPGMFCYQPAVIIDTNWTGLPVKEMAVNQNVGP